ncbi:Glutamate-ammonia-ligase adenylyltransferase [Aureliella helgolandensis]|uniref:Glutamate-ammonia-ligase adenylyltransferase n=2 Tax=Aureliella helgolandensis TaxID=2527968 RepID=A0A518G5L2_9BACT|nr:Glutamate-ammonia-ligase adenylyltransferase [Aureliella helgolandensis]
MSDTFLPIAQKFGTADATAAAHHVAGLAALGLPSDLFDFLLHQLEQQLPSLADPERVLVNLCRFLEGARSPQSWAALFEREPDALETLLALFSTSQYMAERLVADSEAFDLLRMTAGRPVDVQILKDEIAAEIDVAGDSRSIMRALRDFRHRETLRIAYGDFITQQPVEKVTQQISELCDAILQAALLGALREQSQRSPRPLHQDGSPVEFAIIALGKLGGAELNYSSDIDLVFVYNTPRQPIQRGREAEQLAAIDDYFQRLCQLLVRYLSESTSRGVAYRVDMRLRPHGTQGALVMDLADTLNYYDSLGRTWERQAFLKARVVAGDFELGEALLSQLQPWIYRRYLMSADIAGIAALKRRIEHRARSQGVELLNVKLGFGGIRDIEYVVQFLQLLHGGDEPRVRCNNTLEALRKLEVAGCITGEEGSLLAENYCYLRQLEHYLQIMYDRQTHTLPSDPKELENFVRRLRLTDRSDDRRRQDDIRREESPTEAAANRPAPGDQAARSTSLDASSLSEQVSDFHSQLAKRTEQNRKILEHLLHEAFDEESSATPETDLILDPSPTPEAIDSVLGKYGFKDTQAAYRHLQDLAVESIKFLSTRRCRHFLAAIAPKLLASIATTPSPDSTLISLANVSESIGGKAVLWELFSSNTATMDLCVRVCAGSVYLSSILTGNPGMIDELLDSLMLNSLLDRDALANQLDDLCRGANDIGPILQSFKNSMHLRVGVRNILGKDTISETHAALSDIAEACLEKVIQHEFHRLVRQLGVPVRSYPTATPPASIPERSPAVPTAANPQLESLPDDAASGRIDLPAPQQTMAHEGAEAAELVVLAVGKLGGREPNYHSDIDLIFLFDGEGYTRSLVPDRRFSPTTNRHFFNQLGQRVIQSVTRVGPGGKLYDVDVRLRPLGRSGELAITINDLRRYFANQSGQIWERQALCKARPIWGSQGAQAAAMECVREILQQVDDPSVAASEIYQHRYQLQQGAGDCNLKRGVGGTMDIEFDVQFLQLANAKTAPQCLVPGTLLAIEQLQAIGALDESTASSMISDYEFLRQIESGIRLMNMSARHELPKTSEELDRLAFLLSTLHVQQSTRQEQEAEPSTALTGAQMADGCISRMAAVRTRFERHFANYLPQEEADPAPSE